jgi:DNA-binding winged helix-turn-helix (wHTH) protein
MRYFFGDFEFNEGGHHILCRGEEVHVRPKVLALLGRLIRERGRIVPKRELKESLWPGIAVGATSLSTLLGETRAAIGDSGARQQMIRTECGRGYRFIAPVELQSDREGAEDSEDPARGALFAARRHCLTRLDAQLLELQAGRGRSLLVSGEAGSGKSRLIAEMAAVASARGIRSLRGHCSGSLEATPLGPWIEILRRGLDEVGVEKLPRLLVPDLQELVRCTPACLALLQGEGGAAARARFRMIDTVYRFLHIAAASRPCLIIIEDLQVADRVSLQLMDRLFSSIPETPLLFVGSLRPAALAGESRRIALLRRIHACPTTEVMDLHPVDDSDMGKILWPAAESERSPATREAALRSSGGNARLLVELSRLQPGRDSEMELPDPMPPRLVEATQWLVEDLPKPCVTTLQRASVIGRGFDRELLARISPESSPRLREILNWSRISGLIRRDRREQKLEFFAHELVQKHLWNSMHPLERADLHRRIAEAIESQSLSATEDKHARLAYHWRGAAPISGPEKAIEFTLRAGEIESDKGRHQRASVHYRQAVELIDRIPEADPVLRKRVLMRASQNVA